jgi:Mn-dependent DtxR family transcriptional regulator
VQVHDGSKTLRQARDVLEDHSHSGTGALRDKGFILHRAYRGVRLSAEGRRVARQVEGRYEVLRRFLTEVLGVPELLAQRDACEIEHVASTETMERLTAFPEYIEKCKMNVSEMISHFQDYYALREKGKVCPECDGGKKKESH